MNIQQRIEEMRAKTYQLLDQNPDMKEVQWEIKDIPYNEYEELRTQYPGTKNNYHGDAVMFFLISDYPRGFQVAIWSVSVKIKHTYEVIEN